jgi:hypothetical protein
VRRFFHHGARQRDRIFNPVQSGDRARASVLPSIIEASSSFLPSLVKTAPLPALKAANLLEFGWRFPPRRAKFCRPAAPCNRQARLLRASAIFGFSFRRQTAALDDARAAVDDETETRILRRLKLFDFGETAFYK